MLPLALLSILLLLPAVGRPAPAHGSVEVGGLAERHRPALEALERYAAALGDLDGAAMARCLDLDEALERVLAAAPSAGGDRAARRLLRDRLVDGQFEEPAPLRWRDVRVDGVEELDEGLLRVDTRLLADDGGIDCFRWWLSERDGRWLVCDLQDRDTGLLKSAAIARFVSAGRDRVHQVRLRRAVDSLALARSPADAAQATDLLERVDLEVLPAELHGYYWLVWGDLHALRGQHGQALEALDRAAALAEMPIVEFDRATSLLALGRSDEALAHVLRYEELLGVDAITNSTRGRALEDLGREAEAARAFASALDENPELRFALIGLARNLPEDDDAAEAELRRRFLAVEDPPGTFEPLALDLLASGRLEHVVRLANELRRLRPADPNASYYLAEVHLEREEYAEACAEIEGVLPRVVESEELVYYVSQHVRAAVGLGDPLRAYRAGVAPGLAFERLAEALVARRDAEALAELVELRRGDDPADAWLSYYEGQARYLVGRLEPALDAFEAGLDSRDGSVREACRRTWTSLLYTLERPLEAYERADDPAAVYEELLLAALGDEREEWVRALVDRRREEAPGDPSLVWAELCSSFLRFEYEEVLAGPLDPPADSFLRLATERALVLSALRLERHEEALAFARRSTARDGDPFWEGVVHAVSGDSEAAVRALTICVGLGYDPESFLRTPELGRALRGDEYSAFREEFLGARRVVGRAR